MRGDGARFRRFFQFEVASHSFEASAGQSFVQSDVVFRIIEIVPCDFSDASETTFRSTVGLPDVKRPFERRSERDEPDNWQRRLAAGLDLGQYVIGDHGTEAVRRKNDFGIVLFRGFADDGPEPLADSFAMAGIQIPRVIQSQIEDLFGEPAKRGKRDVFQDSEKASGLPGSRTQSGEKRTLRQIPDNTAHSDVQFFVQVLPDAFTPHLRMNLFRVQAGEDVPFQGV